MSRQFVSRPVARTSRNAFSVVVTLASALLLWGCAGMTESRVESSLADAGVPPRMAGCMAEKWVDRLSTDQIRDVSRFAKRLKADRERMTVALLVEHVAAWNDPEAVLVISSSAAQCAFR